MPCCILAGLLFGALVRCFRRGLKTPADEANWSGYDPSWYTPSVTATPLDQVRESEDAPRERSLV